jgi:hypothetical protein
MEWEQMRVAAGETGWDTMELGQRAMTGTLRNNGRKGCWGKVADVKGPAGVGRPDSRQSSTVAVAGKKASKKAKKRWDGGGRQRRQLQPVPSEKRKPSAHSQPLFGNTYVRQEEGWVALPVCCLTSPPICCFSAGCCSHFLRPPPLSCPPPILLPRAHCLQSCHCLLFQQWEHKSRGGGVHG